MGERKGRGKSRNMCRGPMGTDSGVAIDFGSRRGKGWAGQGRTTGKNVGQL